MGTAIIIVVLVIIVIFAVKSGIKHGKGEGGCCGSGGTMKEDKKVLAGDIIATKLVTIEGMHCDNCKNSIEHQINGFICTYHYKSLGIIFVCHSCKIPGTGYIILNCLIRASLHKRNVLMCRCVIYNIRSVM